MRDADDSIIAASKLLRDAGESRRAQIALRDSEQRLAREVADARTLQSISTRLISEVTQESLLAQILDAAMELMRADASSIQMLSADGKSLILLGWRNFHPDSAAHWRQVTTDAECACGLALREQKRAVSLCSVLGEIELTVRDFGVGFDPGARGQQGLGLTSMNERLKAVGGRLSIWSQADGTTIQAFVPIARAESEFPS